MKMLELDYIDNLILNSIQASNALRDVELAQLLQCSRTLILSRTIHLSKQGYLSSKDGQFTLTELGASKLVSLESIKLSRPEDGSAAAETFTWDYLYIPNPGWDRD